MVLLNMFSAPIARRVAFITFLALPPLFFVRLSPVGPQLDAEQCAPSKAMPDFSQREYEFVTKQYETSVQEIRKRVEHEHILFVFKFTATGAVLAFLLQHLQTSAKKKEQPSIATKIPQSAFSVFLWSAVGISQIIDTRLHFNTNMMKGLGCWIRSIEAPLYNKAIEGWETFLADELGEMLPSFMVDIDRFLLTYLLYIVALYATVLEGHKEDIKVAVFGVPASLVLFGINGLYQSYEYGLFYGGYFVAGIITIVCLWWLWIETIREEQRGR